MLPSVVLESRLGGCALSNRLARELHDQVGHGFRPYGLRVPANPIIGRLQPGNAFACTVLQDDAITSHEHDEIRKRRNQRSRRHGDIPPGTVR